MTAGRAPESPAAPPAVGSVWAPACVLFAMMVAHTLLETTRDALFLVELGPGALVWVYIVMAATALGAFIVLGRAGHSFAPRRMLLGFLSAAAIGTTVLAIALPLATWVVFALYIWTGLVATMIVPTFWTLLDRSLHAGQAKRMLALIGAGGVFGAIVGAGTAALLARALPAHDLVTAAALAYALATGVAFAIAPRPTPAVETDAQVEASARHVMTAVRPTAQSVRYLRVLIALGVISTIGLTLGDLVFKRALAERVPAEQLASAFGAIYAGLNTLGLAIQVFVTPRLLARWGVGGALVVLPLIMAASSFSFAATGATLAIIALKLGDGSLRYSLHRVGTEILFLPVPADLRDRSKPIIDTIGLRGGQAVAALMVFGLVHVGASSRASAAVAAILSAVWLVGAVAARRAYVEAFRGKLAAGELVRDVQIRAPDADALALLADSLASPDEIEALAALDVLARNHRVPALVLYHPSPTVVHRALALLAGAVRPEVERVLGHLIDHADPEIRAAAIVAASSTGTHADRLRAALTDPEAAVRAAALVVLPAGPDTDAGIAALQAGTVDDRAALAQAISYAPDDRFRAVLADLVCRGEPRVTRRVLRVYARRPSLADLQHVLALLADSNVRGEARRALVQAGSRGLELAMAALAAPETPLDVRRQLPRSIGAIGTQAAATALLERLNHEPDGTAEFKILRALGRLRDEVPDLVVDVPALRAYTHRAVADAARYATYADMVRAQPAPHHGDLLVKLLDEKRASAVERAFRALGIIDPAAHLRAVHDAIVSPDHARSSAAVEMLDDMLPADVRVPLVASIRPLDPVVRRTTLGHLAPGPFAHGEQLAAELLADPSESVRCIVAYHIAEHKLVGLRADLVRLRPEHGAPLVAAAFDQAIARVDARV